ncbi:hypothetical protein LINPERHAP1_LOCUS14570 [Linum perenne]
MLNISNPTTHENLQPLQGLVCDLTSLNNSCNAMRESR